MAATPAVDMGPPPPHTVVNGTVVYNLVTPVGSAEGTPAKPGPSGSSVGLDLRPLGLLADFLDRDDGASHDAGAGYSPDRRRVELAHELAEQARMEEDQAEIALQKAKADRDIKRNLTTTFDDTPEEHARIFAACEEIEKNEQMMKDEADIAGVIGNLWSSYTESFQQVAAEKLARTAESAKTT